MFPPSLLHSAENLSNTDSDILTEATPFTNLGDLPNKDEKTEEENITRNFNRPPADCDVKIRPPLIFANFYQRKVNIF